MSTSPSPMKKTAQGDDDYQPPHYHHHAQWRSMKTMRPNLNYHFITTIHGPWQVSIVLHYFIFYLYYLQIDATLTRPSPIYHHFPSPTRAQDAATSTNLTTWTLNQWTHLNVTSCHHCTVSEDRSPNFFFNSSEHEWKGSLGPFTCNYLYYI